MYLVYYQSPPHTRTILCSNLQPHCIPNLPRCPLYNRSPSTRTIIQPYTIQAWGIPYIDLTIGFNSLWDVSLQCVCQLQSQIVQTVWTVALSYWLSMSTAGSLSMNILAQSDKVLLQLAPLHLSLFHYLSVVVCKTNFVRKMRQI